MRARPGRGEGDERDGGGASDKKDVEGWRVSGKERAVERDLQETRTEGERWKEG